MNGKFVAMAFVATAACLGFTSDAFAGNTGTIRVIRDAIGTDAYSGGTAGEFLVTDFTGLNVPALGTDVQVNRGIFQTFCMEFNELLTPGVTYNWELNTAAVNGGVSGGNPDPLDARTAYLYTQFWHGTLSNYAFDDLGDQTGERGPDAKQLQDAIWYLEGEIGSLASGSKAANWVAEANQAVNTGAWSGIGNVRILNLYSFDTSGNRVHNQDLLVVVPLPPAAMAGFLLLGGLGAARRLRRRKTS